MKNVLTIIRKEFARFFKDRRMIITVLLPGIMIYAIYSVMGAVISKAADSGKDCKYTAYVENMPQNEALASALQSVLEVDGLLTREEAEERVTGGGLDLILIFPQNFDGVLDGSVSEDTDVKILYNSSKDDSSEGYLTVSALLEGFKKSSFSVNKSGNADLAGERETAGKMLASVMPMLMFALLVSGCVAVAPEAIAGEKERGTMATMLITPIARWQLALGKIISLSCFAMLGGVSSFIGVLLSLPKLMGGFVGSGAAAFYAVGDYFMIFSLIISVVLVIISAFSILSALAKSVKEAGTLISPLMIVIILLGVVSIFFSSAPAAGLFAVPVLGSGLALSAILTFTVTPLTFALALVSNVLAAAALTVLLSFMFGSERIMFNK